MEAIGKMPMPTTLLCLVSSSTPNSRNTNLHVVSAEVLGRRKMKVLLWNSGLSVTSVVTCASYK